MKTDIDVLEQQDSNVISFTDLLGEVDTDEILGGKPGDGLDEGVHNEEEEEEEVHTDPPAPVDPPKKKEVTTSSDSYLKKRVDRLLETKRWKDAEIDLEDGRTVAISDLTDEDLNQDLFFQIDDAQSNIIEDEIKEKYIDKSKLPSIASRLVELAESGGDITDAIHVYDEYIKPFEKVNTSDPRVQERIVREDLMNRNIEPEVIDTIVEKYKKDFILDIKSNEVVSKYNKAFDEYVLAKKVEAEKQKEEVIKAQKAFKEDLEKAYDSNALDTTVIKKLVKLGSTYDKDGVSAAERKVQELLKDPKETSELLMFLFNKDTYIGYKSASKNREKDLKTLSKLNLVAKGSSAGRASKEDKDAILDSMKWQ